MENAFKQFLVNEINTSLEERYKEYPLRGNGYLEYLKNVGKLSIYLREQHENLDIQDNENYRNLYEQPVFICGNMKSGTTLLTELLDNHDDLLVLPGDTHYYNKFFNQEIDIYQLHDYWIQRFINPTGKKPYWFLSIKEIEMFSKYLLSTKIEIPFEKILFSLLNVKYKENTPRYWVEKTPKNEKYAIELLNKFPRAKFINIVRDPLSNNASLKKLCKIRNIDFNISYLSKEQSELFEYTLNNSDQIKNNYCTIKYEDLLVDPSETMKKICNFLDIEYNLNLLKPTVNGISTKANSMYIDDRMVPGINKNKNQNRWKKELSFFEKAIIVIHNYDKAILLGYYNWSKFDIKKFYIFKIFRKRKILKKVIYIIRKYNK